MTLILERRSKLSYTSNFSLCGKAPRVSRRPMKVRNLANFASLHTESSLAQVNRVSFRKRELCESLKSKHMRN
jgi:hypothetical protein